MKKSDLKSGDVVLTRNGKKYMVLRNCKTKAYGEQEIVFVSPTGFFVGSNYDDELIRKKGSNSFDIISHQNNEITSDFFQIIKNEFQNEKLLSELEFDERNFELRDDTYNLRLTSIPCGSLIVQIRMFNCERVIFEENCSWTSKIDIMDLFNEWKLKASQVKLNRTKSVTKKIYEILKSDKHPDQLIMGGNICQILKESFYITDEEHEKILAIIRKLSFSPFPQNIDEIIDTYIKNAPFRFD